MPTRTGVPAHSPVSLAGDVGCAAHLGQLVRTAEQRTVLHVDGPVLQVVQGQEVLGQILVDGIFTGELGTQVGGASQEFVGFLINIGQVILDPQNLGRDVRGADGVAKQPLRPVAEPVVQPGNLLMAAGVHTVENSVAQGGTVLIHRNAVAAQGRKPHTSDLSRIDSTVGQDLTRQAAEASPPVFLRVVFKPTRLGVHKEVRLTGKGHKPALFVDQRSLALVGAHVDPQKIARHIINPF